MRRLTVLAFAAMAFAAAPLAMTTPAAAADNLNVAVNSGGIAFGYSDGYWDRDHQWHKWRNHEEAQSWREHNSDHYFDRRHDGEKDAGWRNEWWWDRH